MPGNNPNGRRGAANLPTDFKLEARWWLRNNHGNYPSHPKRRELAVWYGILPAKVTQFFIDEKRRGLKRTGAYELHMRKEANGEISDYGLTRPVCGALVSRCSRPSTATSSLPSTSAGSPPPSSPGSDLSNSPSQSSGDPQGSPSLASSFTEPPSPTPALPAPESPNPALPGPESPAPKPQASCPPPPWRYAEMENEAVYALVKLSTLWPSAEEEQETAYTLLELSKFK